MPPRSDLAEKRCTKCGVAKPIDRFTPCYTRKDGSRSRSSWCKECSAVIQLAHYKRNKDDSKLRARRLDVARAGRLRRNDHSGGAVRGLLCQRCNNALGLFKDSIEVMYAAIAYLDVGGPKIKLKAVV